MNGNEMGTTPYRIDIQNRENPSQWFKSNVELINSSLDCYGAILISGLEFRTIRQFGKSIQPIFSQGLANYTFRSTPRNEIADGIYTATEYPCDMEILQHHENSYAHHSPSRIAFMCKQAPSSGGTTPISDAITVYEQLPEELRDEFERKGISYRRHYSDIDLPWQEVFQTSDKGDVEKYCIENGIEFQWKDNNDLKTWQTRPASILHHKKKQKVWFNQAHLFHVSALPGEIQKSIRATRESDDYPRHCTFGDGTEIPIDYLETIKNVFSKCSVEFPWQSNQVMILDNYWFTHGRTSFTGERKVLTVMGE